MAVVVDPSQTGLSGDEVNNSSSAPGAASDQEPGGVTLAPVSAPVVATATAATTTQLNASDTPAGTGPTVLQALTSWSGWTGGGAWGPASTTTATDTNTATTATGTATGATTGATTAVAPESDVDQLIGLVASEMSAAGQGSADGTTPTVVTAEPDTSAAPAAPASGGSSALVGLLILAGIGGLGYWLYKRHKAKRGVA